MVFGQNINYIFLTKFFFIGLAYENEYGKKRNFKLKKETQDQFGIS
jgi:hypothetical protein